MNEIHRGSRLGELRKLFATAGLSVAIAAACNPTSPDATQAVRPTGTESPVPSFIIEPSASPTAKIEVTPTPTVKPTEKPTRTETPEQRSELQQHLNAWVEGRIHVPEGKLFIQPVNQPQRLNIIDTETTRGSSQDGNWVPTFQGSILGTREIDGHGEAFIGAQDGKGQQYYFRVNLGELGKGQLGEFILDSDRQVYPQGTPEYKIFSVEEIVKIFGTTLRDETVVFNLFPFNPTYLNLEGLSKEAYDNQAEVTRQFCEWSIDVAAPGRSYRDKDLLKKYPLVKGLINLVPDNFDPAKDPYLWYVWVARYK